MIWHRPGFDNCTAISALLYLLYRSSLCRLLFQISPKDRDYRNSALELGKATRTFAFYHLSRVRSCIKHSGYGWVWEWGLARTPGTSAKVIVYWWEKIVMEATNFQMNLIVHRFRPSLIERFGCEEWEFSQMETQGLQRKEKLRPLQNVKTLQINLAPCFFASICWLQSQMNREEESPLICCETHAPSVS